MWMMEVSIMFKTVSGLQNNNITATAEIMGADFTIVHFPPKSLHSESLQESIQHSPCTADNGRLFATIGLSRTLPL